MRSILPIFAILFLLIHILRHEILATSQENELTKKNTAAIYDLLLVTIATEETDGLRRLRKSAEQFDHELVVYGSGKKWNGGDMRYKGGAQKVKMLRENLTAYKGRENNLIILFVDAYDVVINANKETILRSFFAHFEGSHIVFGAEPYCWPDQKLASKYPPVVFGERYLNSGMFIGFAEQIFRMLDYAEKQNLADDDDDQLFYTKLYLDQQIRSQLKMTLDSISLIFQNLNGADEFVNLEFDQNFLLYNKIYNTHPFIIHGNGPSKIRLNELANYLVKNYVESAEIDDEKKNQILNGNEAQREFPQIVMAIFIYKPIPYVEEFLDTVAQLEYPKQEIHLSIYNTQRYNKIIVDEFVGEWTGIYASIQMSNFDRDQTIPQEHQARLNAIELAEQKKVEFLFSIDADVHLTNPRILNDLLSKAINDVNYLGILSPLVLRPGTLFSNFWGAVSHTGFYARSFDYVDIVQGRRQGIWNVPFVGSALLISARKFPQVRNSYTWNTGIDADIAFAEYCRTNGHFMYIDAMREPDSSGFLVNSDGFANLPSEARINLEIYDFPNNRKLWEKRYIHPEYFPLFEPNNSVPLGCPDVYDFPFLSERCCKEIIEIMEDYGQWSDGTHKDKRIQGGYENVPTRDIHMNQVGFDRHWLSIVDQYVAPIQEKVFIGFYQRPVRSDMMFVVRYRPNEQASLRPHHDASTWSIDIALNRRGVDYEGGGVRYIRYNCTVEADKIGWSMLFPGRLTHLHEGLPTTKGTRYILVSFINP